jgi:hypothetical protein
MAAIGFRALGNSTVIVVAVVYGVLLRLGGGAGLFGMLLTIMVTLSLWRFGYAVLRHVARGWNHFPPPGIETMNPFGEFAVIFHSLLFASLLLLLATTPFIDGTLRWLLLVAVLAVFPASAAVMAMTTNLGASLSPVSVGTVMRELGSDYWKQLGVRVTLGALMLFATWLATVSWFLGVFGEMLSVWTVLALFLATGAALRAHRADFDLLEGLDDADERAERQRQGEWQKTLDRAYASIRSRLPAQGYRTIKELLASEGESLAVYQWTFNGMLEWDEPMHAAQLGEKFAAKLWEAGRQVDALELVQRCRKLSPSFSIPAERAAELAAYARSIGRHRLADELAAVAPL